MTRALRPSDIAIDGIYETRIDKDWCLVKVTGEAPPLRGWRRFYVCREPYTGNSLNARYASDLRVPKGGAR